MTAKRRASRIGVVGLGYVGLPLAVEFGKQYETIGFDVNPKRVAQLRRGRDLTLEVTAAELKAAKRVSFTTELERLKRCQVFIVTVPTPIDGYKRPDLGPLMRASESVGAVLRRGAVVIYESTVYPGCTEEVCVPILERVSGLKFNRDFFAGYSPERINPGDHEHRLTTIRKVTSGSTPEVAEFVDELYGSIVTAGTHKTSSIRVAEAAKVIENTQRDVNIALINELALIFNRLEIDTEEVLNAAGSKWNFLPFRPGLVGGHCIGVDPYYLTHKAQEIGYHPEMILAGRRLNDNMALQVAGQITRLMAARRIHVKGARALVLGITFKENCPDVRNSKVVDVVRELQKQGAQVDIYDPWANASECRHEYGLQPVRALKRARYDVAIVAVAHRQFRELGVRGVHLAAQAGVRHSLEHPHAYVRSNVTGTLNVLEGCRHHGVEHLVYASTSSVYGANTNMPFSEHNGADHPLSLYAASKRANELMAHTYSSLFKLPTTGLRFFTVYGPWGRPDMALFLFTRNILEGKPIDVFNHGHHRRDFTYVDDIAEGVVRALERIAQPDPSWDSNAPDPASSAAPFRLYNIGNNQPVQLMRYIEIIEECLGRKAVKNLLPLQPGDVPETCADIEDLVRDVGYRPATPVEVGVRKFVDWFCEYYGYKR